MDVARSQKPDVAIILLYLRPCLVCVCVKLTYCCVKKKIFIILQSAINKINILGKNFTFI